MAGTIGVALGCGGPDRRIVDEVIPPLGAQRITFVAADGFVLYGTLARHETSTRGVICLHMWNGGRGDFDPLLERLRAQGFNVLAFDLRGSGESVGISGVQFFDDYQQRDPTHFRQMLGDVDAARQYLVEVCNVDPRRVALIGAGVGASIVVRMATRDRNVPALVLMSPGERYLDLALRPPMRELPRTPILMTTAQTATGQMEAAGNLRAASRWPEMVEIRPVAGDFTTAHGTRALRADPNLPAEIAQFLAEAVR